MTIGILGGTFDPPHFGHLGAAKNALASGLVSEVWLVPCLRHRLGKKPATYEHRLAMCRLLIEGQGNMSVSDMESKLKRPGYTLDLVLAMQKAHPNRRFRLIVGTDIYFEKEHWFKYEEVAKLTPPIYIERKGVNHIPEPALPAPPKISSAKVRLAIESQERPEDMVPSKILDYIAEHRIYWSKC